jgi:general secretion pathway protein F
MKFKVRYLETPQAKQVLESVMEAPSPAALTSTLQRNGHVMLSVVAQTTLPALRVSAERLDVAWWCRELCTLLKAGMTVVEAIETMHMNVSGVERGRMHAQLLQALQQGQALSKAMQMCQVFPEVLVASVMASERTSTLETALNDYLIHDDMIQRMKRQAVSAAIYPGMVMTLGSCIALFLLLYVVPRFSRMYEDIQGTASWPTQVLLWISHAVQSSWPVLVVVGGLLIIGLVWAIRQGHAQQCLLGFAFRIKPLKRQLEQFRLAKFYQSMALMFRGGYTVDEAMAMCERLKLGKGFSRRLAQARQAIMQGKPVAASLAEAGLTEPTTERLLAVGERTGGFDAVLQTIANRHAEQFATFMERTTRIVEPLMLLLVALMVGGIVVLMYMPIFDIASSIG